MFADILIFLKRFALRPKQIGSIIPSSRFLSARMMRQIPWERSESIVELGPGTGVFTKEIINRKKQNAKFFVVENDPHFQKILRKRFPKLMIRNEAIHLKDYVTELQLDKVDAIISGLPFAVFSESKRSVILDNIEQTLSPGGVFVTFQYSLQLKKDLEKRFDRVKISFSLLNLPPAFIYTCYKQK